MAEDVQKTIATTTVIKIEKCILTRIPDNYNNYDRLYFGTEFCHLLIPNISEYKKLTHKNITLVFPPIYEKSLKKVDKILQLFKKTEVVFNDWGTYNLIKKHNHIPVLGRLLTNQQTDPRIILLKNKIPKKAYNYFKNIYTTAKVKRIEVSNTLQGIKTQKIPTSLYYPQVPITITRACISNGCDQISKRNTINFNTCKKECQTFTLNKFNKIIYMKGNVQYYLNEIITDNKADRLVLTKDFQ